MEKFRDNSGAALIVTLLVIVVLTVTVTEFLFATWVDYALAADFRDDTKAIHAVRAGVKAGRAIIVEDYKRAKDIDSHNEQWAQPSIPIPFYNTFVFITIRDEYGKFNINSLIKPLSGQPTGGVEEAMFKRFERLLENLDVDIEVAEAIADWIDADNEGYYEYGVYQSLEYPYDCKNFYLDSLDEIKLVDGVTPEVYEKLKNFITVGKPVAKKININTAPPELLMALHENISRPMAETLINARKERSFKKKEDLKEIIGFEDYTSWTEETSTGGILFSSAIDVKSKTFSVSVTTTIGEVTRNAEAVFWDRNDKTAKLIYFRIL
jgi:general secretion pathway protein K